MKRENLNYVHIFMFQLRQKNITHIAYSYHKEITRKARFECKRNYDENSDTNARTQVQYLNFVLNKMIDSSSHDEETSALIRRFTDSFMERFDVSSREVLWYASFGDLNANECIGCIEPPTRSQPVHEVVSPHRKFKIGEDPVSFERSQIEYMDTSNDVLLKKIHQGRVPRAWRSSLISIWPRTANLRMKFDMQKLLPHKSSDVKLSVRITYLMDDTNVHGGDWEELGRRAMGT